MPATSGSTVIAAWIGAIGVVLTWAGKLLVFVLNRWQRVSARLVDGPGVKVVNRSAVGIDIQPLDWGGRWTISGNPEGVRYVRDVEGDYIRLDPKAELVLIFRPDRDSLGSPALYGETVIRLLREHRQPIHLCRRDGKVMRRIPFRDIQGRLRGGLRGNQSEIDALIHGNPSDHGAQ